MNTIEYLQFNPLAKFFEKYRNSIDQTKIDQSQKMSQGISQEEYDSLSYESAFGVNNIDNVLITAIDFGQVFEQKIGRISKYREMSVYPEISKALDILCDEAIVEDENGDVIILDIKEKVHKNVEKRIRDIWKRVVDDIFEIKETGWPLFRKYITEAEIFCELIMNEKKNKIIGYKILPAFTMTPIYKGNEIIAFKQKIMRNKLNFQENDIDFSKEQIVYINFGIRGESIIDQRGYLESSIRIYNQLKNLEDALIIYRLVRAPERRLWNISTGKMPKGKAEEYIKGMINRYKRKSVYDPETGKVDSAQNIQALTEDFWFSKSDEGKGTEVTTLTSGLQLGEIRDVDYFLKKLYLSLKVPRSRFDEDSKNMGYDSGKVGIITRDEITLANMVKRIQDMFKYLFFDTFILCLKMEGIDENLIDKKKYSIKFSESNLYKIFKKIDIEQNQLSLLSQALSYVKSDVNPEGIFSKEFAFKKFYYMTEEEREENEKLIKEEDEERKKKKLEDGDQFSGGGGFGGVQNFGGQNDFGGGGAGNLDEPPNVALDRLKIGGNGSSEDIEKSKKIKEEDKNVKKKPKSKMILGHNDKLTQIMEYIDK